MKAWSMLGVLLFGKTLVVVGQPIEWTLATPLALVWQDLVLVCLFAAFERLNRPPLMPALIYWVVVMYVGCNVPLLRLLATPLTWPMMRATRGTLADSILHHLDSISLGMVALVTAVGILFPIVVRALRLQAGAKFCVSLAILATLGWHGHKNIETGGFERNPLFTLAATLRSRVPARPGETAWRDSPAEAEARLSQWRGKAKGRNVILILLESTGSRYLKSYGASEDPMPNLTQMARQSLLFERAYAVYPESIKGLFSILCSRYPAMDLPAELHQDAGNPGLAEVLRGAGYRTALFHSGRFMYLGMEEIIHDRGFERLHDAGDIGGERESSFGVEEPAAVAHALEWVASLPSDEPFFLTYLPIAGHHPYLTPGPNPFPDGTDRERYLNALHYADRAVGELTEGLRRLGKYDNSLLVLCGDHGEAFGQHPGNFGHTLFIYEENIRVPLVVVAPGLIDREVRAGPVASLIDVAPTILDLLGVPVPAVSQGVSLLQFEPRMALFFTDYSFGLLGLRDDRWKFIYEAESGRSKLFDLRKDPYEQTNVEREHAARVHAYRERLQGWMAAQNYAVLNEAE
jgi:arylsulfatase A-like enzyme